MKPGDTVQATDPSSGRTENRQITHAIRTDHDKQYVDLTIRDDDGQQHTITATDNHPFWSATQGRWIDAGRLETGDLLKTSAGTYVQVEAVRPYRAEGRTYDLTVDGIHTYFVVTGAAAVLVHNTCGVNHRARYQISLWEQGKPRLPKNWDAHHRIPQRYEHHPEFADFDFDDPSNIRGIPGSMQPGRTTNIHQQVTTRWENFHRDNPTASRSEIEAFADRIGAEFEGFWWYNG